jgi:hypothetical protein
MRRASSSCLPQDTRHVAHIFNMCWTPRYASIHTQENITRLESCYTNRTWFLCGKRGRHHNIGLRTQRHMIGQHKRLKRWAARNPPSIRILEKGKQFLLLIWHSMWPNIAKRCLMRLVHGIVDLLLKDAYRHYVIYCFWHNRDDIIFSHPITVIF